MKTFALAVVCLGVFLTAGCGQKVETPTKVRPDWAQGQKNDKAGRRGQETSRADNEEGDYAARERWRERRAERREDRRDDELDRPARPADEEIAEEEAAERRRRREYGSERMSRRASRITPDSTRPIETSIADDEDEEEEEE
jgi:hypothetical protein